MGTLSDEQSEMRAPSWSVPQALDSCDGFRYGLHVYGLEKLQPHSNTEKELLKSAAAFVAKRTEN